MADAIIESASTQVMAWETRRTNRWSSMQCCSWVRMLKTCHLSVNQSSQECWFCPSLALFAAVDAYGVEEPVHVEEDPRHSDEVKWLLLLLTSIEHDKSFNSWTSQRLVASFRHLPGLTQEDKTEERFVYSFTQFPGSLRCYSNIAWFTDFLAYFDRGKNLGSGISHTHQFRRLPAIPGVPQLPSGLQQKNELCNHDSPGASWWMYPRRLYHIPQQGSYGEEQIRLSIFYLFSFISLPRIIIFEFSRTDRRSPQGKPYGHPEQA